MAAVHTEQAVQLFPTAPGSKARRLQTGSEAADPGPQLVWVGERRHLRVTRSGSRVDPPAPPRKASPVPSEHCPSSKPTPVAQLCTLPGQVHVFGESSHPDLGHCLHFARQHFTILCILSN